MDNSEEDDDLILVKASGILLTDLEDALPKLLWKPAKNGNARKVHSLVKRGDLDHVTRLVRAFTMPSLQVLISTGRSNLSKANLNCWMSG